jgi:CRP/FNR family transcriptional regulator, anaerobic regulatory protein
MTLLTHLKSLITVSPQLEQEILRISGKIKAGRGEVLLNMNERCRDMFFVEKGLLRGYYLEDGREVTNWFAPEGDFATCFYSFIVKEPSFECIQCLEDTELVKINYTDLQQIYAAFPETERVGRLITENYYIKLEERLISIQFKTAKERYLKLMATRPFLLQRASLGQIASYLGMSQETLSRIRADL